MLKHNSVNVHLRSSHCKFGACQKWEQASYIGDFGNILTISLKAHYYPAYQVGADSSDWTVPTLWNSLHENFL